MTVLAAVAGLSACASGAAQETAGDGLIADPFEPTNRAVHGFNKAVDRFALRPAAQVYDAATPGLVKHLVGNAVDHLSVPSQAVQGALRGDFVSAATSTGRFVVNTVVGAGGLLDPATEFGLPAQQEDFGRTLAAWGVGEGPYVELPLLGPSTARDAVGRVGGAFMNPVSLAAPAVDGAWAEWVSPGATAVGAVDFRAEQMSTLDTVLYDSADSYALAKSLWLQQRRALISGGDPSTATPDIYEDEPF